jgi:dTDP-4-amino-4,6-dideoxygalactose transaminase
MRIPFNDLYRLHQALAEPLGEALRRVAQSGWYILGPEVKRFEKEFAAYVGSSRALALGNGTDALELALRALECGPGDEVITVANAGFYTTSACVLTGAMPVFVDVDEATLTMCPRSLASAIGPRTKAVVVTHLYGQMADMPAILSAIGGRPIRVVEDCAQAHGAMLDGRRAGSFGDLGSFSFYPTKNLGAMGDGGALVSSDGALDAKLRQLRQYGWSEKYHADIPHGRNSRMDEMQAAVLLVKLPLLDGWNERRREIARRYRAPQGTPLRLVHEPSPSYVGHLCIARHPDRDEFRRRMQEAEIETAIHYPRPDHAQLALKSHPWRAMSLATTERATREIVSLPCFPELTDEEIDRVCDAMRRCA